jgi:hypothetical protein
MDILSPEPWELRDSLPEWAAISEEEGEGSLDLAIGANPNETGSIRMITLDFQLQNDSFTGTSAYLIQAAPEMGRLFPPRQVVPEQETSYPLLVSAPDTVTEWELSGPSWVTLSPAGSAGLAQVEVTVDPLPGGTDERSGTIRLNETDSTHQIQQIRGMDPESTSRFMAERVAETGAFDADPAYPHPLLNPFLDWSGNGQPDYWDAVLYDLGEYTPAQPFFFFREVTENDQQKIRWDARLNPPMVGQLVMLTSWDLKDWSETFLTYNGSEYSATGGGVEIVSQVDLIDRHRLTFQRDLPPNGQLYVIFDLRE